MNKIESIAYSLLKDAGMTDEEIIEFRIAADHPLICHCELCKNYHKLMPKENKNENP